MRVAELWRYPVKSLRGERLQAVDIDENGIPGDRLVHVRQASGRVVTSRFRPGLLGLQGSLDDAGEQLIDGLAWRAAGALERVRAVAGADVELVRFAGGDHGQRHDVLPLTVLTTGMAEAVGVDRRRFRPNVVIAGADGLAEVDWPGSGLRAGSAVIGVRNRRSRCVMTTFDPDTLEQDPRVLQRIVRSFGGEVALDCWVLEPGRIAEGDAVELVELPADVEPPRGNGTDPPVWHRRSLG
jgi:MOSC domain-containing protein